MTQTPQSLRIVNGQPATITCLCTRNPELLAQYAIRVVLVTMGNQITATLTDGSGITRSVPPEPVGFVVTFTGQQTANAQPGSRLVVSLEKTGHPPIQDEIAVRVIKNLIPS